MKIKLKGKAKAAVVIIVAAAAFGLGMLFEHVHTERFVIETISADGTNDTAAVETAVSETAVPESAEESSEPAPTAAGSAAPAVISDGKININTADAELLDKLEGIGPSIAQRIVDYRTENGNFESIEELTLVSGIGEKKLDAIRDKICVE